MTDTPLVVLPADVKDIDGYRWHAVAQTYLHAVIAGFGGTPLMELYLMYHEARAKLEARGYRVARSLVGNFVTSLEMAGCSLTVTRLDDEIARLWDAPAHTAALRLGM